MKEFVKAMAGIVELLASAIGKILTVIPWGTLVGMGFTLLCAFLISDWIVLSSAAETVLLAGGAVAIGCGARMDVVRYNAAIRRENLKILAEVIVAILAEL